MKGVIQTLAVGCLLALLVRLSQSKMAGREVRTRAGIVRGYLQEGRYYAYLGIPYARPMVGRNRFMAPKPPEPWQHPFDASRRVRCPQPGLRGPSGVEHCLVVNVMVSTRIVAWSRPVLVIVHGGDFVTGWGAYNPPERFIDTFIVVTFNYRLGVLGFLCLGTAEAPGNIGLKDQVAAIYWIHKNIDSFGGDPDDVTVYGIGSGAASVQILLLSGLMTDLIHRVILESGSVLSPTMMTFTPYATALNVAKSMMFEPRTGEHQELAAFYKKQPLENLLNISTMFLPCIENAFHSSYSLLDRDPMELLKSGRFEKVPMLVAYTHAQEAELVRSAPELFRSVPEYFEDTLPSDLVFEDAFTRHRVGDVVKAFYFGDNVEELSKDELLDNYVEYIDDVFMEYPAVKFAMLYASKSMTPVYLMRFAYKGAKFGDIFTMLQGINVTDYSVSDKLYTLWRNFMTINDPTPLTTSLIPLIWQPMLSEDERELPVSSASWLVFRSSPALSEGPSQRLIFWDHIYTKFRRVHRFDKLELELEESWSTDDDDST